MAQSSRERKTAVDDLLRRLKESDERISAQRYSYTADLPPAARLQCEATMREIVREGFRDIQPGDDIESIVECMVNECFRAAIEALHPEWIVNKE